MKKIILLTGLLLLALLGIGVVVSVCVVFFRKKRQIRPMPSRSISPDGFHRGTVLMDHAQDSNGVQDNNVNLSKWGQNNFRTPLVHRGYLRHEGEGNWPGEIQVRLQEGCVFSIGRFDVTLGRQVSDFEFEPNSKAVSRRHAEIACDAEGFMIQDLVSKAGTIVNGVALECLTYYRLMDGFHVSFGTAGADYIWHDLPDEADGIGGLS